MEIEKKTDELEENKPLSLDEYTLQKEPDKAACEAVMTEAKAPNIPFNPTQTLYSGTALFLRKKKREKGVQ